MNAAETRELDNVLETARLRSVHRLRVALQEGADPNPLDVLVVASYRDSVLRGQVRGPWSILRRYGPPAGAGAGFTGIVIAIIDAVARHL